MDEMIKRRKDQGFTLIELMIVIAVIGILAIVLVPRVGAVKTSAKSAGIDVNVRTVQGYVHSRITAWNNDPTTFDQKAIAADIAAAFSDSKVTDPLKNPFATAEEEGTGIADAVNNTSGGLLKDDTSQALQIVGAVGDGNGHGSIEVVVPKKIKNGIIINGLNQEGAVYSSVKIKP